MNNDKNLRNPQVPEFIDIDDAYSKLEEYAHKVKFEDNLSTQFQKLRDEYERNKNNVLLQKCQIELEVQSFVFVDGKANPQFIMNGPFPDLANYQDHDLTYLKDRHDKIANPTLKARYAHLLWDSKMRHSDFAKSAVDSYLLSIQQIRDFELEAPKKSRGHRITNSIKSLWHLSKAISYKKDEATSLIKDTFLNYDYDNPSSSSVRLSIINLVMENWKDLGAALYPHIEPVFTIQRTKTDIWGAMDWLRTLGVVNNKSKLQSVDWKLELAGVYEELAKAFEKEKNPASTEYIGQALELYKSLKNIAKVAELEKWYDQSKKSIRLGSYSQSIDLTESAKAASEYAKDLLKEHGTGIFNFLRDNADLIPKIGEISNERKAAFEENAILQDIPQVVVDHRGNNVEHFTTAEEIAEFWDLRTYGFHIECNSGLLLRSIFLQGIKDNVITADSFEAYLKNETWLSTERKISSPKVDTDELLLDLIVPSIRYFIKETCEAVTNTKYRPDFVLCCDSLGVKIEGLLRSICEQHNEVTFFMKDDKSGRKIVNEQDINSLLYSRTVKNLFSEDQLYFLRFILVEKMGMNWRHKVAHSLSFKHEYSFNLMVLLTMCLLIIAKRKVSV